MLRSQRTRRIDLPPRTVVTFMSPDLSLAQSFFGDLKADESGAIHFFSIGSFFLNSSSAMTPPLGSVSWLRVNFHMLAHLFYGLLRLKFGQEPLRGIFLVSISRVFQKLLDLGYGISAVALALIDFGQEQK